MFCLRCCVLRSADLRCAETPNTARLCQQLTLCMSSLASIMHRSTSTCRWQVKASHWSTFSQSKLRFRSCHADPLPYVRCAVQYPEAGVQRHFAHPIASSSFERYKTCSRCVWRPKLSQQAWPSKRDRPETTEGLGGAHMQWSCSYSPYSTKMQMVFETWTKPPKIAGPQSPCTGQRNRLLRDEGYACGVHFALNRLQPYSDVCDTASPGDGQRRRQHQAHLYVMHLHIRCGLGVISAADVISIVTGAYKTPQKLVIHQLCG